MLILQLMLAFLDMQMHLKIRRKRVSERLVAHMPGKKRTRAVFLAACLAVSILILPSCGFTGNKDTSGEGGIFVNGAKQTLHIVSGSENEELEPILRQFAEAYKINIVMDYKGSLDIMRELMSGTTAYDAVWPASSLWLSLGDTSHKVKHAESVSITPVVFGVRRSLAESLGFVGTDVSVSDILAAITSGGLSFCMTSATQSNSGASAYIGFLYALLGNPDIITAEDLDSQQLRGDITALLSGVDRSSGSSNWLKEMFLESDYDAMVNYECLMISANQELVREGREPLYIVYPYDGLAIADSPLGYVDNGDASKEEAFLKLQDYLLSDAVQDEIQKTGRRTGYAGVSDSNKPVFNPDWGIDTERILSPIKFPASDVIFKALNLYQTEFKKPSLNVYCLDFSSSMYGDGNKQLIEALGQIMLQENAAENFLQASPDEVNIVIAFNNAVIATYTAGGDAGELESLYNQVARLEPDGGTDIYTAAIAGLQMLGDCDLSQYSPAIILMTDGQSQSSLRESGFERVYADSGMDVPVFSIMFGNADDTQLKALADITTARVFDGRTDLIAAFRNVKGYN
jgi:Ca-activated chloride channel family protein